MRRTMGNPQRIYIKYGTLFPARTAARCLRPHANEAVREQRQRVIQFLNSLKPSPHTLVHLTLCKLTGIPLSNPAKDHLRLLYLCISTHCRHSRLGVRDEVATNSNGIVHRLARDGNLPGVSGMRKERHMQNSGNPANRAGQFPSPIGHAAQFTELRKLRLQPVFEVA